MRKRKKRRLLLKRLAAEISWIRGVAWQIIRLGSFTHTNQLDSALFYEREAISIGIIKGHPDVSLISYSALAEKLCALQATRLGTCQPEPWLSSDEAKAIPQRPFCKAVLTDAIRLSSDLAQPRLLIRALQLKDSITNSLVKK